GTLRALNSCWVGEDSTCKFFEVLLLDPFHEAIRRNPGAPGWLMDPETSAQARGPTSAGHKSRGLRKCLKYHHSLGGSPRS
ncbi:RL15 protein, partial [Crocuta crocuta]